MMETCLNDQTERQVVRHDDFHLPEYWEVQSENVAQFSVKVDCDEYRKIYYLFHQTMANKYTQIIQIDRIQNKQWYMQYSSLKKFSPKKDTEKTLFHGCARDVAALIVRSFFNRSFAGVNGMFCPVESFLQMNIYHYQVLFTVKVPIFLPKLYIVMDLHDQTVKPVNDVCLS